MKKLTANDFALPILASHAYDDLERAMQQAFAKLLDDNARQGNETLSELTQMHEYGTPFLGSHTVIERFTKLNGLAVLRRENGELADRIMAVILAQWLALASERGLAFVQFVLDMLYPKKNKVTQLWHSKSKAHEYPNYLYETNAPDRFLTSRVRIRLDNDVDIKELAELIPVFRRLVPWQIVPEVAIGADMDGNRLGVAVGMISFHVADFTPKPYMYLGVAVGMASYHVADFAPRTEHP